MPRGDRFSMRVPSKKNFQSVVLVAVLIMKITVSDDGLIRTPLISVMGSSSRVSTSVMLPFSVSMRAKFVPMAINAVV